MAETIAEYLRRHRQKRGERRGELRPKREAILRLIRFRFDAIPESVEKKVKSTH